MTTAPMTTRTIAARVQIQVFKTTPTSSLIVVEVVSAG